MFSFKKNGRIVVLDDEPGILRTLKRILEKKNYAVTTFQSPAEALEYLKANGADLIITDLKMPEIDGIQFLDKVRTICPRTPVILMTAYATIDTAVTAMLEGAFDYIRKPFEIRKLYEVVERALISSR